MQEAMMLIWRWSLSIEGSTMYQTRVLDEQAWIGKSQACCMLACSHILLGKLESTCKWGSVYMGTVGSAG